MTCTVDPNTKSECLLKYGCQWFSDPNDDNNSGCRDWGDAISGEGINHWCLNGGKSKNDCNQMKVYSTDKDKSGSCTAVLGAGDKFVECIWDYNA